MSRIETIEVELREAMKARDAERRDALRLILVMRLGCEVAFQEPHAAAVQEVNGGDEQHQLSARKFLRIRAPTPAERSG